VVLKDGDVSKKRGGEKNMLVICVHTWNPKTGEKLNMSLRQVKDIVEKLEAMKTFCYRSDNQGSNWAYPLAFENTVSDF
jgi:hypothetical protein